ncbi:unnamed protein product [Menidia menidia]|uniref:(Atlantic silverside) hypothetical protein n=1 Tax=Menidia menidia TaxID=238744 RepID=A0A8S4BQ29_9TELE|nr:unnamed protein product [Menidia menidia]
MQPPPRKVKLVFAEQLSKLQAKQHQTTELLEEIRSFSKQRAAIEKEYGQALQRLAIQFQKRDWQRGNSDAFTSGGVFGVWRSVVDATAQSAASRLDAAEEYRKLIGQASKSLHNAKDVRTKRGLEQLQRVQGEVVEALRELHKIKKRYYQLCHIAMAAREKAAEAQTRARKMEHGIFHFKTGAQKVTAKLSARLTECDDRLTEVRNEYLLTLAAINAHHEHYNTNDLPLIMQQMDGDIYKDLRHHFTLLCGTEMDICQALHKQYGRLWDNVAKVSALQDISASEGDACLLKEAQKWATRAAKDYKIVAHGERALQMLESRLKLLSGETGLSVEQKIAEVQESVRKAKVLRLSRVKADARLAVLSDSVPGTEQWLHQAMKQAEEELERERHLSQQRKSTEDFSEDEFELTDFDDYDENGDIFIEPVSASGLCICPAPCRVIYSYQARQADELSIMEGEDLQVIDDGEIEDWLKRLQAAVLSMMVPVSLARALYAYQAQSAEELSFPEGALIHLIRCQHGEVDDGFWEGELDGQIGVFPSLVVELLHNEEEVEAEQEQVRSD